MRVCFLPIHSGHQVRWTYQPGSHRRKVTQDFYTFCGASLNFYRENDSAIPFPHRPFCRILCTHKLIVLRLLGMIIIFFRKNPPDVKTILKNHQVFTLTRSVRTVTVGHVFSSADSVQRGSHYTQGRTISANALNDWGAPTRVISLRLRSSHVLQYFSSKGRVYIKGRVYGL